MPEEEKKERNREIVKLHDKDPKKYSFGRLGIKYNIKRQTAHEIYHRLKRKELFTGNP